MSICAEPSADAVTGATADIALGKVVVVLLGTGEETVGNLVFGAELATPELMAFVVRHTSGYVCVALEEDRCDRLQLPLAHQSEPDEGRPAYAVAVDASSGIGTGISATDRALTVRRLADANATAASFTRPGHVVTLRARKDGLLGRCRGAEAAVDLARLAGLRPAGALSTIVSPDNGAVITRRQDLVEFAVGHGLSIVSIDQIVAHRRRNENHVQRVAETSVPTSYGAFEAIGYRENFDGSEHLALVLGDVSDGRPVLTGLHSGCLIGDVFGASACDCASQLAASLGAVAAEGRGVVLYMRGGRGIPFEHERRPFDADGEDDQYRHGTRAQILTDLGVRQIRLLTTEWAGAVDPEQFGVSVIGRVLLLPAAPADPVSPPLQQFVPQHIGPTVPKVGPAGELADPPRGCARSRRSRR